MGCSSKKQESGNNQYKDQIFEEYTEPNNETFEIILYYLGWKTKDEICSFMKKKEDILIKRDVINLEQITTTTKIKELNNYGFEIDNYFLLYVYLNKGVIITKSHKKVNYLLMNYIEDLIKICFVDFSEVYKGNNIYFNFHEIKEQSRYFFELNNKEIKFIYRNKLMDDAKNEILSDIDIHEKDDSSTEEEASIIEKTNKNFRSVNNL